MNIQAVLFAQQDLSYRSFQCRLMPSVNPETVIGVRTPVLRRMAGQLRGTEAAARFLAQLPHAYYEENNLHAFLLEQERDFDRCIAALEAFLPHVDNWATCDQMNPKVLGKHPEELLEHILRWLKSGQCYTVRFAIELLMRHYLDGAFRPAYLELVAGVKSDEYYVNMMCAWYFATALAKQYAKTIPYLENRRLPLWIHNKTIQKAVESRRISPGQKAYLRTLKRKEPQNS